MSTITETIVVHGAPNETLPIVVTPWGPVVGKDWEGRSYALQWSAENAEAVNFKLIELEHLDSVADALGAAPQFGIPAQNFMVADHDGHIGWTIAGRIPKRAAAEPNVPQLSTDAAIGFTGWLPAAEQPRVIDPPTGLLWSANNRVIGGAGAQLIGDDEMNRGARASQIHGDLEAAPRPFSPAASLRVQLDDRSLFLVRWRTLLIGVIDRSRAHGDRSHDPAGAVLSTWSGHASPADAAYRLVHAFRGQVEARTFFMLVAAARLKAPDFEFVIPDSFEGPLWRLMEQRPQHLLAANYADWDALLLQSLQAAERLPPMCQDLASCTWGSVNELKIEHPLSAALPWLSRFLNMPIVQLPGAHGDMPRIQGPDYGASERFSVAPGYEEEGYFNMPGGESGHPLSPFYRAGFAAWAEARATPFLPGPPAHTLTLTP